MKKAKGTRGKCDVIFSKIIRARDGHCVSCGTNQNLQCAHIISRRYSGTRCDTENAITLCAGCHIYFTQWPIEFARFIAETMGEGHYETLKARATEASTFGERYWKDKLEELKPIAKEHGVL